MTRSASGFSHRCAHLALAFALTLCSACAEQEPAERDPSGLDGDDDVQDNDAGDDDQADDDQADDDQADDDADAPAGDAGRHDAGTPPRDAGKMDSAAPSNSADAGMTDSGRVADAARDASLDASSPDATSADAASADASAPSGELCELKGHQVAIMGDSYIDLNGKITEFLQQSAREAGALGPTETYIDTARSGAAMQKNNLLAPAIPTQLPTVFTQSMRRGSEGVKLIVMTGGGNDVLIDAPECKSLRTVTETCKAVVDRTLVVVKKLFADMKAGGIEEVIYFWYPDLGPNNGKVINDYSIPLAKEACESNTDVRCHFVDTREAWRGHPEYIGPDGIHPTEAGSKVIAGLVWDVMVEQCLGSK